MEPGAGQCSGDGKKARASAAIMEGRWTECGWEGSEVKGDSFWAQMGVSFRARKGGNVGLREFSDGHTEFEALGAHSDKVSRSWLDVQFDALPRHRRLQDVDGNRSNRS